MYYQYKYVLLNLCNFYNKIKYIKILNLKNFISNNYNKNFNIIFSKLNF